MSIYRQTREHLRQRRRRLAAAEAIAIEATAATLSPVVTGPPPGGGGNPGGGLVVVDAGGPIIPPGIGSAGAAVSAATAAGMQAAAALPVALSAWATLIRPAAGVIVDEHFFTGPGVLTESGSWSYGSSFALTGTSAVMYFDDASLVNQTAEMTVGPFDRIRMGARSSRTDFSIAGSVVFVQLDTATNIVLQEWAAGVLLQSVTYTGGFTTGDVIGLAVKGATATATKNGAAIGALSGLTVTAGGYWGFRSITSGTRGIDRYALR